MSPELLEKDKKHSPGRTKDPTLLQSMLVCKKCGYAYYRTSTNTTKHKINYYRCLGSDNYRYQEGRRCDSRPIRQDYLDELVWTEMVRLLQDEELIERELQRRIETSQNASPSIRRQEALNRENTRLDQAISRLLDAYQAELMTMDELRPRLNDLRKKQQSAQAELRQIESQNHDSEQYLKLANTLTGFLARLQSSADTLNITDRQRIVRLLVKEILVDDDTITLKHVIPITAKETPMLPSGGGDLPSYLLRSGVMELLLANVYLHYVLYLWAHQWRRRYARGDVIIVRWADDFVIGFQYQDDARRFHAELRARFQKFSLELHPEKTRLLRFGRFECRDCGRFDGMKKPETFDFLGFTHCCSVTETGKFKVCRVTMRKRLTAKLHEVKAELRRRMHQPIVEQAQWLRSVVRGYFQYHAIPGNWKALGAFRTQVARQWYRSLRRRSHKHKLTWDRMTVIVDAVLPPARILHPWPEQRLAAIIQGRSRVR